MYRKTLLAVLFPLLIARVAEAADDGPVWFWFSTCGGPLMGIEVRFDNVKIFKTEVPLCRAERASTHSDGQQFGRIEFTFSPARSIVWQGYRDTDDTTRQGQLLEGNIWQAGADPNDLLLGVTFADKQLIYMNTVHIAHPAQRDETEIAKGLKVLTYPIARERESKR